MTHTFARTTCACAADVANCRRQPGSCVPGDLERIAAHLELPVSEAKLLFWASPGAIVADRHGNHVRVGTITPRKLETGCVFLDPEGRCKVHAVAPFGCAYFDMHMGPEEGNRRAIWAVMQQASDMAYQRLRLTLARATSWAPVV